MLLNRAGSVGILNNSSGVGLIGVGLAGKRITEHGMQVPDGDRLF